METIILNNGVEMPKLGLGTFLIPEDKLEETIVNAYNMGYRKFDTAWRYHNEKQIADILKKHGIKREDVFITTKINIDALYYGGFKGGVKSLTNVRCRSIAQAIEESFENLQTDYIDLFLVHYPYKNFRKLWKGLEKYYRNGKIRAIGVSSFLQPHLRAIEDISDITPAVNQIEISPLNTQKELIDYCQQRNIAVEAMSTFSHFRSNEPRLEIIENPVIQSIAEQHNKSTVQIVLRWLLQQNVSVIPKTWNKEWLLENISVFDFSLNDEEMKMIDALDQGRCLNYNSYTATRGLPIKYKNLDFFYDEKKVDAYRLKRPLWVKILF